MEYNLKHQHLFLINYFQLEKIKKDYDLSAEVYGVAALTANSLIDAASIYHPIEEDLLQ